MHTTVPSLDAAVRRAAVAVFVVPVVTLLVRSQPFVAACSQSWCPLDQIEPAFEQAE